MWCFWQEVSQRWWSELEQRALRGPAREAGGWLGTSFFMSSQSLSMWFLYGLVWTSSQHGSLRQEVTQTYKGECSKRQAKWYAFYNQAF